MNQPRPQFCFNMASYRGDFEDEDYEDSCTACRVSTPRCIATFVVNFHSATNGHFQKKTTKFQVGKLESLLRIVCLARKKPSMKAHSAQLTHVVGGEDAFAVSGLKSLFSLFRSRKNAL